MSEQTNELVGGSSEGTGGEHPKGLKGFNSSCPAVLL